MSVSSASFSTCAACGRALSPAVRFCPACGARAEHAVGRPDKPHVLSAMILAGIGFLGLLVVMLLAFQSPIGAPPTSRGPVPPRSSSSVGVTAPTPVPAPSPALVADSSPARGVRPVSDNRLGFQIEMPDDWVDEPDGDGHILTPTDDSTEATEISGLVKFGPRGPGDTLRDRVDAARKELQDLPRLAIESETNVSISGHPAVKIDYRYFQPAAECPYFGVTVVVERPEGFCQLIFHALEERRQRYQPVIEQMIHSFRIAPIANP